MEKIDPVQLSNWPSEMGSVPPYYFGDDIMPVHPFEQYKNISNVHVDEFIIGDTSMDGIVPFSPNLIPTSRALYIAAVYNYFGVTKG